MTRSPPSSGESRAFSLDELSKRIEEAPERLAEWRAAGLVGDPERPAFTLEDVECARLIQLCLQRGFAIDAIVEAERREPGFLRHYVHELFPDGPPQSISIAETAATTGMSVESLRRIHELGGPGDGGDRVAVPDVEALRGWKVALDQGVPEEVLFQLVRVYADNLGRIAQAEARLFHFYVHDRLRAAGLTGSELGDATRAASEAMRGLMDPTLRYFHRHALGTALREDLLLRLGELSGRTGPSETPAELRLAIAFLDLSSFTPMTASMGDLAAAKVVERFSEIVRGVVTRHHGRVVERIGDAFMLAFPDAQSALACALEIEARAAAEPQFPAVRGGIHVGSVLYREGGYIGTNVNLASRVANQAGRHEILVTAEARGEAGDIANYRSVGEHRLKGMPDPIELFEARPREQRRRDAVVDPVCGMDLAPAGIAASLVLDGGTYAFCSETCLRAFFAR